MVKWLYSVANSVIASTTLKDNTVKSLPSITTTYFKSFKLYIKSYIYALPFVLLLVAGKYALNLWLPEQEVVNVMFFSRMIADIALSALFFGFIIQVVYYLYHHQKINYLAISTKGIMRFIHLFLAYVVVCLPIMLTLLLIEIAYQLWVPVVITQDVAKWLLWTSLSAIGVALFFTLVLYVFCFAVGIFITIRNQSFISAINQSRKMITSFWMDTLLIVILFGLLGIGLDMLFYELQIPFAYLLSTLLLSTLLPSLMVVHVDYVEKAANHAMTAPTPTLKALATK